MFYAILIITLFHWATSSFSINLCKLVNTELNKYHDGNCSYSQSKSTSECICTFSKDVMHEEYYGLFDEKCIKNPCKNNSICKSGKRHICKYNRKFHGMNWEYPIKQNESLNTIQRPSIAYRIKSKHGENLSLILISDTFGNNNYHIIIKGAFQEFRYIIKDFKQKISVTNLRKLCSNTLNTPEFNVNNCNCLDNDCQNMCDIIPKLYDNEVEIAIVPYFMAKTKYGRENIYFDSNETEIMGRKYNLEVQIYIDEANIEYSIPIIQFVVDDAISLCLPYIENYLYNDEFNSKMIDTPQNDIMELNRNKQWIFGFIFTDGEFCNSNKTQLSETYEWKIFNFSQNIPIQNYDNVKLQRLVAVITGPSPMHIEDRNLILNASDSSNPNEKDVKKYLLYTWQCNILDDNNCKTITTTDSIITLKKYLLYEATAYNFTLTLNVNDDYIKTIGKPREGIASIIVYRHPLKITTMITTSKLNYTKPTSTQTSPYTLSSILTSTSKKISSTAILLKTTKQSLSSSTLQNITTQMSCMQSPMTNSIHFLTSTSPWHLGKDLNIKCIQNCAPLSNPSNDLHLEANINLTDHKLKWYFQQFNDTNMNLVENITLTDVATHILVVKKNMLQYGTTYNFFVSYPKYALVNVLSVTTISKPKIGNCTIQPQSGIAGKTLFTISCIDFRNENDTENKFEYYQNDKNNEETMGVLLYGGNTTLSNFKLTSSKYLTVKVINAYGASVKINLIANISVCETSSLSNLFEQVKMHLKMKDTPRAIAIILIISDILYDNHINIFNKLFIALDKIPIVKHCIFCIDQFVLIYQKVIKDYYKINNNRIEIINISNILKKFLKISNALFEYIIISDEHERMKNVDNIDRIKIGIQNIIVILQRDILIEITVDNNQENPLSYSSSKINNVRTITHKMERLLTMFGKIVILNIIPYKRAITCENINSDYKSCILLPEWIKNRSFSSESNMVLYDTIGKSLANELLLKGYKWGITIMNVKNTFKQMSNKSFSSRNKLPIILLDILRFEKSNSRNFNSLRRFENYIDLNFKTNDIIDKQYNIYTIEIFQKNNTALQLDKSILVFRLDMRNISKLFVSIRNLTHDLRFVWLRDFRPDSNIMIDNKYTVKLKVGKNHGFMLKTLKIHEDKIHYIGLSANVNKRKIEVNKKYKVHFSMIIYNPKCLYWTGKKWDSKDIIVGPNTTDNNLHCQTRHTSFFTGTIIGLPNTIDSIEEITTNINQTDGLIFLIIVLVMYLIYSVALILAKIKDRENGSIGEVTILHDNYPGEDEAYLVIVHTGNKSLSGTTSNVCIQLIGENSTSRIHWLHSPNYRILKRHFDDWFIIFTSQTLGELSSIHIWHDSYGRNPSWYCKRIEVICLRNNKIWCFNVNKWFTILISVENMEGNFTVSKRPTWDQQFRDVLKICLFNEFFLSFNYPRTAITQCQHITEILTRILALIASYLFLNEGNDDLLDVEDVKMMDIFLHLIHGNIFYLSIELYTSYCFHKAAEFQKYTYNRVEWKNTETNKNIDVIKDEKYNITTPRLPNENKIKIGINTKNNNWLGIGWISCAVITIVSSIYIIYSGLTFNNLEAVQWIVAIMLVGMQNRFLVEPSEVLSNSILIHHFNQAHYIMQTYKLTLYKFRINTKQLLQNSQLIRNIRESRERYVYEPIHGRDGQILIKKKKTEKNNMLLIENVLTAVLLVISSVCCIYSINAFTQPKDLNYANSIAVVNINNLLKKNTMDIYMLKTFLHDTLVDNFHVKEYYNGKPIHALIKKRRGYTNMYNSKIINAGVRITQKRITYENNVWTNNKNNYTQKWIKIKGLRNIYTCWQYREPGVIKYFNIWFPYTPNEGYILDLSAGKNEYKETLKYQFRDGWLDKYTRRVDVQFMIYSPHADALTTISITFETVSGLLFSINKSIRTIPGGSLIVSIATYIITLISMCMYFVCVIMQVYNLSCKWYDRLTRNKELFDLWLCFNFITLIVTLCIILLLAARWHLMEYVQASFIRYKDIRYSKTSQNIVRVHDHVIILAAIIFSLAVWIIYECNVIQFPSITYFKKTLDAEKLYLRMFIVYSGIIGYYVGRTVRFQGYYNIVLFIKDIQNISFVTLVSICMNTILCTLFCVILLKHYIILLIRIR